MFVTHKKDYFGQKAGTTLDIDEPHTKSLLDQGIVEAGKGNPYGSLRAKATPQFLLTAHSDRSKLIPQNTLRRGKSAAFARETMKKTKDPRTRGRDGKRM